MKKKAAAVLIVLAGAVCTAWYFNVGSGEIILKGEVEADVFSQVCQVNGRIVEFPAEMGQEVKAGDIIAVIDSSDSEYALAELKTVRQQKVSALAAMEKGPDQALISQAQSAVDTAEKAYEGTRITWEKASEEYDRSLILYNEGAIPKEALDNAAYQQELAENAVSTASSQIAAAKQQVSVVSLRAGEEELSGARAAIEQIDVQINKLTADMEKYVLRATCDGTILSKNYQEGDMVMAGYNLADVSSLEQRYLVFYIPKESLSAFSYGQEMQIKAGENQYASHISYIGVDVVYTPKRLQTTSIKNKETVEVRAKLSSGAPLKPGENAEVTLLVP